MGKGVPTTVSGEGSVAGSAPGAAAPGGDGQTSLLPGQTQQGLPETTPDASQPVTLAAVQQLLADRDQQLIRQAQSLVDKSSGRLERKFAELQAGNQRALAVAKQTGMTPEALAQYEEALNRDALQKAMSGEPQGQPPLGQPQGLPQQLPQQGFDPQAISAQGAQIAASFGLTIADPEARFVIRNGTPEQYLTSIQIAGQMKQSRLGGGNGQPGQSQGLPQQGDEEPPAKAAARAPAVGVNGGRANQNPIKDVSATGQLYDMAWEAVKKKRRGQ